MPKPKPRRSVRGVINYLSLCPHGQIEGIVVGRTFVKLPPHHDGERALASLKVGQAVAVSGEPIGKGGHAVLHHARIRRAGKVVFDHELVEERDPPAREPRRRTIAIEAVVRAVGTNPHGEIDRLLLDGDVTVHVHKHAGPRRGVARGTTVAVSGEGSKFARGTFVHADEVALVR